MINEIKIKKNRSAAYPAISLDKAVDAIRKIREALGKDTYSREAMAKAIGYKGGDGYAARIIAALVHFGLLKRDGNIYRYSDLSDQILYYESDEKKAIALSEAVKSPKLYNSLILKYANQALPTMLTGVLAKDFAINPKVASDAVKDFIKSIEYAGLFKNGVVLEKFNNSAENNQDAEDSLCNNDNITNPYVDSKPNPENIPDRENAMHKILELPCGAILYYPSSLAYEFAIGVFSEEIKALNEKINNIIKEKN